MANFDRKDRFYKKAKDEGHVSRSFYKLEQIQSKYKVIKKGARVIDLGCAPGDWLEIASKLVGPGGAIFGIDLLPVKTKKIKNVKVYQGDIYDEKLLFEMLKEVEYADIVISDMAPDISGVKFKDSYLSFELACRALEIAQDMLKAGGNFVVKIFPGEEFAGFKKSMEEVFTKVSQFRPEATRKSSIEVYLIGLGFKSMI